MTESTVDMLHGPLHKSVIRFAVPIVITNLLSIIFNATDLIVVGRFCGSQAVAAVGATSTLVALMVNFFIGLSSGCGVVVAQRLGAGDSEGVSRAVHTSMSVAVVAGVFVTAVGVIFSKDFLRMMSTPEDIIDQSALYLKIYFGGVVLRLIYSFAASILRAGGDTDSPMKYLSLGGFLNVGFNLFFVLACGMSVDGVAWGTVISEGISAVLCVRKMMQRTDAIKFSFKKLSLAGDVIKRIVVIGIPAGFQSSLFAFSNVIIQSSINSFGSIVVAGNSAANNIGNFIATAGSAFQHAATNFVGQNYGARNYKRLKKIPWVIALWATVFCLGSAIIAAIFARPLLSIYLGTDATALKSIEYGVKRIYFCTMFYFICAIMEAFTGAMRGLGKSVIPMTITLFGCCGLRILWVYTVFRIPQFHSIESLYISYPISWVITSLVEFVVYGMIYKRVVKREKIADKI